MLPVMLDVKGKKCVVVGGGRAAKRKAETLFKNGARVTVIAEEINADFDGIADEIIKKPYSSEDIDGCFIAVAATDSAETNKKIMSDARNKAKLFMSADGGNSDMAFMAYAEAGDTKIAVSTGGRYPMLGEKLCGRLGDTCKSAEEKAVSLKKYRERILGSSLSDTDKRNLLEMLVSDEMLEINDIKEFERQIENILEERL